MEELHIDSIDGGHEASYRARSRARERAYSNNSKNNFLIVIGRFRTFDTNVIYKRQVDMRDMLF
jgi:hypothetical protein